MIFPILYLSLSYYAAAGTWKITELCLVILVLVQPILPTTKPTWKPKSSVLAKVVQYTNSISLEI